MSMLRTVALGSILVALGVVACAGLKESSGVSGDDGGGVPVEDGGAQQGSDAASDAPPPDAAPPPPDFTCSSGANDTWANPVKSRAECQPRQVKVVGVEPDGGAEIALDVTGISIARTPSGRVGIAYNHELESDSGEMRLVHFVPTSPSFTPTVVRRAGDLGEHLGYMTRLAATGPDVLHLLAYDMRDHTSGDVVVMRLTGGTPPLTDPEAVRPSVKPPTEVGFAVDSAGTSVATLRLPTSDDAAAAYKLAAFTRPANGAWSALRDVRRELLPNEAPGTGSASLFFDATGQLHLLYHHCEMMLHSQPRYHTLNGSAWSDSKTVDNATLDGLSGYSPRIAAQGAKKFAVYFFRKALQGAPTADLRLATWELTNDRPKIEVLDQGIASPSAMGPRYRVAMAVDPYGLVHLAIVRPNADNKSGYLEYRRQARDTTGAVKWLSDVVDRDVLSGLSNDAWVDLIVDQNARPHIAYWSGADGKVRYATRYDR